MLHLLLVEDNPADVLMIREAMRRSPIPADVVIAYDGAEGLRLLTEMKFDLVLLDLNLPKFSGHAILENYRVLSGPPVVVFTGSQNQNDKALALMLGARDYVVKPSNYHAFISAVQDILEQASATAV